MQASMINLVDKIKFTQQQIERLKSLNYEEMGILNLIDILAT